MTTTDDRPIYAIPVLVDVDLETAEGKPLIDRQTGEPKELKMYAPTEAQVAIFARMMQSTGRGDADSRGRDVMRSIGLIFRVLDLLIVDWDDKEWLDNAVITGDLEPLDALGLILAAGKAHFGAEADQAAPTTGPARLKRRR